MNEDQAQGAFKTVTGRAQTAVGALGSDGKTQFNGKTREFAGNAQSAFGDLKDKAAGYTDQVTQFTRTEPLKALGIAVGGGLLLGMLMKRR